MKALKSLLLAGVATVLASTASHASLVTTTTQTLTFGPALTEFQDQSQTFDLFDTSLGTLVSITIGGSYGFTSTLTITNSSASSSTGTAKAEGALGFGSTVTGIDSVLNDLLNTVGTVGTGPTALANAAFDLTGSQATYNLDSNGTTTASSNKTKTTLDPVTDSTVTDLAPFEAAGGGTADVLASTFTSTLISNTGGNTSASQATTATGTFTIYYTYDDTPPVTPVPEPTSMAILGVSLIGLGLLRRKLG